MNKVIILGNDHTNTLGLVQSFGVKNIYVIAAMWGVKSGIVACSKYVNEIISASTTEECIQKIALKFNEDGNRYVVIPACDYAAVCLEQYRPQLADNIQYQHTRGDYSIRSMEDKDLQVRIASESGFYTPQSWEIISPSDIPTDIIYPCLIKSLASFAGSKNDLLVCYNNSELQKNLEIVLARTPRVLVQHYINKSTEYTAIGCSLKDGRVYVPFFIKKLAIYPKNVGLESVVEIIDLPKELYNSITTYMQRIKYVGVFSVEFMHSKDDDKIYFTEANIRNDGDNGFVTKSGCNVPYVHYTDIIGTVDELEMKKACNKGVYIWDMHHFLSLLHGETDIFTWLHDLIKSNGYLTIIKNDRMPFFKQYTNWILLKLHLKKNEQY